MALQPPRKFPVRRRLRHYLGAATEMVPWLGRIIASWAGNAFPSKEQRDVERWQADVTDGHNALEQKVRSSSQFLYKGGLGAGLKNAWSNCGLTVVDLAFGRVRVMFPSPTAHPGYHVSVSTSEGIAHVLARGTRGFELHFQSSEGVTIEPTEVTFEIVGFVDGDLA